MQTEVQISQRDFEIVVTNLEELLQKDLDRTIEAKDIEAAAKLFGKQVDY